MLRDKLGSVVVVGIAAAVLASVPAGTAYGNALEEEPTPTVPAPAPDPAPPAPKPKPAPPKPAPRVTPKPARVYRPPTPASPPSRPTYTPPRTVKVAPTRAVAPRKQVRRAKKKKVRAAVAPTPKPKPKPKPVARVKAASVVRIPAAAVATEADGEAARRAAVISGMGLSAMLFFAVLTVPATRMRFTAAGRVIMDHQIDLVLTGVAVLLLTAVLFYLTGTAS